jgi:hypothetical protein
MSELIDRYLDGDLGDDEARAFMEAVRRDPELVAELRTYEQMLSVSDAEDQAGPSAHFTDEVMNRVTAASYRTERHGRDGFWSQWAPRLSWAAGLVVFFGLGQITARVGSDDQPTDHFLDRGITQASMPAAGEVVQSSTFRVVRLIYVPEQQDVQNVTVAGTFNGWNPSLTPMQKQGNVWIVQLVLPPDTHEYMFVVNGETWVTDPLAQEIRDDGFGRENAVLDLRI